MFPNSSFGEHKAAIFHDDVICDFEKRFDRHIDYIMFHFHIHIMMEFDKSYQDDMSSASECARYDATFML